MFYVPDLLKKGCPLFHLWIAANTSGPKLSRHLTYRKLRTIRLSASVDEILKILAMNYPDSIPRPMNRVQNFSLYLSAKLMYGSCVVLKRQTVILENDINFFIKNLNILRKREPTQQERKKRSSKLCERPMRELGVQGLQSGDDEQLDHLNFTVEVDISILPVDNDEELVFNNSVSERSITMEEEPPRINYDLIPLLFGDEDLPFELRQHLREEGEHPETPLPAVADAPHVIMEHEIDQPTADALHVNMEHEIDQPTADAPHVNMEHEIDQPTADAPHVNMEHEIDQPTADASHVIMEHEIDQPTADAPHVNMEHEIDQPTADASHVIMVHETEQPTANAPDASFPVEEQNVSQVADSMDDSMTLQSLGSAPTERPRRRRRPVFDVVNVLSDEQMRENLRDPSSTVKSTDQVDTDLWGPIIKQKFINLHHFGKQGRMGNPHQDLSALFKRHCVTRPAADTDRIEHRTSSSIPELEQIRTGSVIDDDEYGDRLLEKRKRQPMNESTQRQSEDEELGGSKRRKESSLVPSGNLVRLPEDTPDTPTCNAPVTSTPISGFNVPLFEEAPEPSYNQEVEQVPESLTESQLQLGLPAEPQIEVHQDIPFVPEGGTGLGHSPEPERGEDAFSSPGSTLEISADTVLKKVQDLTREKNGPITMDDLCPPATTRRKQAVLTIWNLLELKDKSRLTLNQEVTGGEIGPVFISLPN